MIIIRSHVSFFGFRFPLFTTPGWHPLGVSLVTFGPRGGSEGHTPRASGTLKVIFLPTVPGHPVEHRVHVRLRGLRVLESTRQTPNNLDWIFHRLGLGRSRHYVPTVEGRHHNTLNHASTHSTGQFRALHFVDPVPDRPLTSPLGPGIWTTQVGYTSPGHVNRSHPWTE